MVDQLLPPLISSIKNATSSDNRRRYCDQASFSCDTWQGLEFASHISSTGHQSGGSSASN